MTRLPNLQEKETGNKNLKRVLVLVMPFADYI